MTPAEFSLNFLWLDKNIAVAVDQVFNQVGGCGLLCGLLCGPVFLGLKGYGTGAVCKLVSCTHAPPLCCCLVPEPCRAPALSFSCFSAHILSLAPLPLAIVPPCRASAAP